MRLDSLTMRGIFAFEDTVSVPFRDLPPGLIAVVGENGAGKTTTMEAPICAIYGQFPSREKKPYDYATRADACIEVDVDLEGRGLYRARLALDKPHRKSEAVLMRIGPDGRPTILNDGKISTYEALTRELFPRYEDLLASVVAAQTKVGSFSELDRKGRRELFGSLLGLDHYARRAERCRQAIDRISREIETRVAERDVIERQAGREEEDALEQHAQQLQVDGGAVESRRVELRRLITAAEQALSTCQEAATRHAAARATFDRLEAQRLSTTTQRDETLGWIARTDKERAQAKDRAAKEHDAWLTRTAKDRADRSGHDREIETLTTARDKAIADATERIENNRGLQADGEKIRTAVTALARIDDAIAANRRAADVALEPIDVLRKRSDKIRDTIAKIEQAEAELARAEQDASLLNRVPFGEQCAPCEFVAGAVQARESIARLRERVSVKADRQKDQTTIDAQLETAKATVTRLTEEIKALERERAVVKVVADRLPNLTQAEERITHWTSVLTQARERWVTETKAAQDREHARVERLEHTAAERIKEHEARLVDLDAKADRQIEELTDKAAAMAEAITAATFQRDAAADEAKATKDAARQAETATATLTTYRAEWDTTTERLATVRAQVEDLARRRQALAARRTESAQLLHRIDRLRIERIEWETLLAAFAPDGLPTLEIDAAGPTVSAFANDLLQACFGGRFSMEIVTQVPKTSKSKDGSTHKEVFEAHVYDQQRAGEVRDLKDLSGGEKVIIEEVLRSAIALLVNTKNRFPIRTAWRDETTGALDPDKAVRYIAMLRRMQQIGNFHQIVFVTHNPDCAALADAQLVVASGRVEIALPPFGPRAEVAAA